jgi:hypothetical protein
MSVLFDAGGGKTLTLPTPDYGTKENVGLNKATNRAMGGRVVTVLRQSGTVQDPELVWLDMSDADLALARTYFHTTIVAVETFTYTDWLSVAITAAYLGGVDEALAVDFDSNRVEIKIAKVA